MTISHSICNYITENPTPVHELVDEIVRRTNERAGPTPDKVSNVPIILRVEYKHCANLTIYDTPVSHRLLINECPNRELFSCMIESLTSIIIQLGIPFGRRRIVEE